MTLLHELHAESNGTSPSPRGAARIGSNLVFQAFLLIDSTLIVTLGIACGVAYDLATSGQAGAVDRYIKFSIAAAILFSTSAHARGLYGRSKPQPLSLQLKEVTLIWTIVFLTLMIVISAVGVDDALSRETFILFFVAGLPGILVLRWGENRALLYFARPTALVRRQVVVVGQSQQPLAIKTVNTIESYGGYVCKTVSLPATSDEPEFSQCMGEVIEYLRENPVDEILLATSWTDTTLIEKITQHLRVVPLPVKLIPDPSVSALLERPLVELGPTKAIELQRAPLAGPQLAAKRLLDVAVTVPVLVLLLPALAVVAAVISLDSPGPVLFYQRRIGFNGRRFQIYKFRTMKVMDDGAVIQQAQQGDPRITRVGRVLRRFSIDELPQLLNVLRGEMSLVGPRPHALAHDNEYGRLIALYAARYNVKPGLTGWAQVNGWRGATPQVRLMMKRVEYDLWYINHWSLWLDIKILLLTALTVCKAENAY